MEPAAERLGAALAMTSFAAPEFPVYANTTAQPVSAIADALTDQLVGTVRFAESLRAMAEAGVDTFVHVGPGDVTAGMARRTVPDATVLSVSSLDGIADAREALAVQ
jgi:[acyl-carrier-protein] S-malonyltransferase